MTDGAPSVDIFDGFILGAGSTSGVRVVVGLWPRSRFGPVADAMVETVGGHRVLLAPSHELADYIAATYRFDEVRVQPVRVGRRTGRRPDGATITVHTDDLSLELTTGRRTALGTVLRLVPGRLARSPGWARLIEPVAARLQPGVHTAGTAGNGRREYYGALDQRLVEGLSGRFDGTDLGSLAPIDPPVRFGFGSVPRRPSLVRVVTTVQTRRS